jgi:putative tributyrin esterase
MKLLRSVLVVALAAASAASRGAEADVDLRTVSFRADSVERSLKYKVALPPGYDASDRRYPVLYMLHGFSGNYLSWLGIGAPEAARKLDLILVFPDGGNSWYINWAKNSGHKNQWEDMVVVDLIGHVDANFRTIARREGRAICGLSMGGYGAMVLGLRHPEMFCSIGSHSGALSYAKGAAERLRRGESLRPNPEPSKEPNPRIEVEDFDSQLERTPPGEPFATPEDCDSYDPARLVLQVPRDNLPHLFMNCGTEDGFLPHTLDFLEVLLEHRIPFTYSQSPGEHKKAFWAREVHEAIAIQYAVMSRSLRAAEAGGGQSSGQ